MTPGTGLAAVLVSAAPAFSLAATMPLGPSSVSLRTIRAGLAITLMAILSAGQPPAGDVLPAVMTGALAGAALGLSATIVARAVTAAAALMENMLAPSPLAAGPGTPGTVRLLYECAFSWVFLASGAFGAIVGYVVHALAAEQGPPAWATRGLASLGESFFTTSLALAAPACLAQMLAALVGGTIARAAPQVNGLLLNAPLLALAALGALIFSAPALPGVMLQVARAAAQLSAGMFGR
jgi:type III secretory pathway component EscT